MILFEYTPPNDMLGNWLDPRVLTKVHFIKCLQLNFWETHDHRGQSHIRTHQMIILQTMVLSS
jgi:hypothetical protein